MLLGIIYSVIIMASQYQVQQFVGYCLSNASYIVLKP
jgi:hypothetical protein